MSPLMSMCIHELEAGADFSGSTRSLSVELKSSLRSTTGSRFLCDTLSDRSLNASRVRKSRFAAGVLTPSVASSRRFRAEVGGGDALSAAFRCVARATICPVDFLRESGEQNSLRPSSDLSARSEGTPRAGVTGSEERALIARAPKPAAAMPTAWR